MALAKLLFLLFHTTLLFNTVVQGREFLVGGKADSWKVPSPSEQTLNQWAEATRFQVGDSLVWRLGVGQKDSVLEVTRADYLSCNTSSPIVEYTYGSAVVKLVRSGPYYFISAINGACEKGEKIAVVVMSEKRHHNSGLIVGSSPSSAPSPLAFEVDGPAVAPTSNGYRNFVQVIVVGLLGMMVLVIAYA